MARKKGNEIWWIVGAVAAGIGLYFLQTGVGAQNNSALIPDRLEERIDRLIARLNEMFGRGWVDFGLNALRYFARTELPPPMVELIDVVTEVEMLSRRTVMSGPAKRQLAIEMMPGNTGLNL